MDYKEKYNAALERARNLMINQNPPAHLIETIFPELKEDKDERIRKTIYGWIYTQPLEFFDNGFSKEEMLAWVEKHGENKPADNVELKFHHGDWVILNGTVALILDKQKYGFVCLGIDGKEFFCNYGHIDSMHHWTIQDAKDGDIVYYECHGTKHLFIVKSVGETEDHVEGHFWYDITRNECEIWDGGLPYSNIASMYDAIPATKEQCDLLFQKMKEANYEWDSKMKELKKIEPKFHPGDWIIRNAEGFRHNAYLVKEIIDYYVCEDLKGRLGTFTFNDVHNNFKLWDISDAKDGNVLVNGSNIFLFHYINNKRLMGYCHVNIDDGRFYDDTGKNECFCTIDAIVNPATKEQRDLLFEKMKNAGYVWNDDKKELNNLLQDLEWFDMETNECHCYNCELFDHENNVCECIDLCKNPKNTYKGFYVK